MVNCGKNGRHAMVEFSKRRLHELADQVYKYMPAAALAHVYASNGHVIVHEARNSW